MAKKYGAMFILLPLSDAGLPESLQEKKDIIGKILERAIDCGLTKEDIIVDGLVTTVGANPNAALETLETIRYCREKQLATVCGLSNISFGLPQRAYVNSVFLTMAIQAGLTMAIANPSSELLVASAFASDMLLHKEGSDLRYIEYAASCTGVSAQAAPAKAVSKETKAAPPAEASPSSDVYNAVLKGNRSGIGQITRRALDAGFPAKELLDNCLIPAINQVGELFDKGKYFLPQLISSAEAMKLSIGILEPLLSAGGAREQMPVVVIATVEGDIHDIGKNLVALMLKNYGFQVIDLGKDVPKETIGPRRQGKSRLHYRPVSADDHHDAGNETRDRAGPCRRPGCQNHYRRRGHYAGICGRNPCGRLCPGRRGCGETGQTPSGYPGGNGRHLWK